MSYSVSKDTMLEISAGRMPGLSGVNKFGRATDVDQNVDVDIWDRANSTDAQDEWVPPTTARQHTLASSSANDTSGGTGARTVRVYGLTSWSAAETNELVTMSGTSNVTTSGSYVIIHRMIVETFGTAGPNDGQIEATAVTDATVTAQIQAGQGQTQMAIYGIPSTKTAYVIGFYASAIKAGSALSVAKELLVAPSPDVDPTIFLVKHTDGIVTDGTNKDQHDFRPYKKISGPAIIKVRGNASAVNTDVSGGFDLILEDN